MLPYTLTLGDQSLKDIYETGTPYTRCIPIPQGSFKILVLFSVKPYIEYRYNYLFTHKSHTATLRSGNLVVWQAPYKTIGCTCLQKY